MSKPTKTEKDQWKGGIIIRHNIEDALTEKQKAFVALYVMNGGNAAAAGRDTGIESPQYELENHLVRQAVEQRRDLQIKTQGATQAWQVMHSLMTDPANPAQVRFQAARWTLEASGHGLAALTAALAMNKTGGKDQHEMSVSELQDLVQKAREQLTVMRKDPVIDIDPPQPAE